MMNNYNYFLTDSNMTQAFNKACNKYADAMKSIREVCIKTLTEICNRRDDKIIDLTKLYEFGKWIGVGCPVVTYDGGNDIDDEPNCYSTVDGFRIESDAIRGEFIVLDIEDDYSYGIDRVLTVDIIRLCETIIQYEASGEYKLGVSDYGDDE